MPGEVLRDIANRLPVQDALALLKTCRAVKAELHAEATMSAVVSRHAPAATSLDAFKNVLCGSTNNESIERLPLERREAPLLALIARIPCLPKKERLQALTLIQPYAEKHDRAHFEVRAAHAARAETCRKFMLLLTEGKDLLPASVQRDRLKALRQQLQTWQPSWAVAMEHMIENRLKALWHPSSHEPCPSYLPGEAYVHRRRPGSHDHPHLRANH